MAENMSLADQAVQALAMVKAMDDNLDMNHPERHAIRSMKRVAQQLIEAGLRSAIDLAWQADDLRRLAREIEAIKAAPQSPPPSCGSKSSGYSDPGAPPSAPVPECPASSTAA